MRLHSLIFIGVLFFIFLGSTFFYLIYSNAQDTSAAAISDLQNKITALENERETLTTEIRQADLEKKESENQSYTNRINSRIFTFEDGKSRWGLPYERYDFSFANATGSILHVCDNFLRLVVVNGEKICLSDSALILETGDTHALIETFAFNKIGDEFSLKNIAFNTGSNIIATSTNRTDPTLLLYTDTLRCLWNDGLCWNITEISHLVTFPDFQITKAPFDSRHGVAPQMLVWSKDSKKAFYMNGCPEGCPEELLVGLDLENKTTEILLTRKDFGDLYIKEISWIDSNTVLADGVEIDF